MRLMRNKLSATLHRAGTRHERGVGEADDVAREAAVVQAIDGGKTA
jgi:hypothetical protein